jgi:sterol 3beta-glucosyltransferase
MAQRPLNIGLQTWGSDGDILPFIALAAELVSAGHRVSLAYTSVDGKDYRHRLASAGAVHVLAHHAFNPEINPYSLSRSRIPAVQLVALLCAFHTPATEAMLAASQTLCAGADVVIGHPLCDTLTTAAELARVPRVVLTFSHQGVMQQSVSPTGTDLGSLLNSVMWHMGDAILTNVLFRPGNAERISLGLRPFSSVIRQQMMSDRLTIIAASKVLCPIQSSADGTVAVTGPIAVGSNSIPPTLPTEVTEFLARGPAPVLMTFGSCTGFAPRATSQLLHRAARLAGVRAIVQTEPDAEPCTDILTVGTVPHSELLPHCSAMVHHAGAGSVHAALRAGVPQVAVPHAFDQPFWADQIQIKGLGINAGLNRDITPYKLAEAMKRVVHDSSFDQRCKTIALSVSHEDGAVEIRKLIENRIEGWK